MNLIKKFLVLTGALSLGSSSTAIVVACGPKDNELQILVTPFTDGAELNQATNTLETLIQKKANEKGINKKISVIVTKNFDVAANSIASGNAALGFLGTNNYYQNSILGNKNTMHQLFYSTRTAFWQEYNSASYGEISPDERLKLMNQNGSMLDMKNDQFNIFGLVTEASDLNKFEEIATTPADNIGASYYRGYQYTSKVTLKKFREVGINSTDKNLSEAWSNLTRIDPNNENYAIFKKELSNNPMNLHDYWLVVWNIYEQAIANNGIGLANQPTSSSGRISPIWTMMEAYIMVNKLDTTDPNDIKKAQDAVFDLLNKHTIELDSYATNSLIQLMTGKDGKTNRIDVGIGSADNRTDYDGTNKDYSSKDILDEITIFTASHGISNDGVVYSTRYFNNQKHLLKPLQEIFIDLIDNEQQAKDIFFKYYAYLNFLPLDIDDETEMEKYEKHIADLQNNPFRSAAVTISSSIKPKGNNN